MSETRFKLVKHSLDILYELGNNAKENEEHIEEFKIRVRDLDKLWEDFIKYYVLVENSKTIKVDSEQHLKEYEQYESIFYKIKKLNDGYLDTKQDDKREVIKHTGHSSTSTSQFVIPKINLPSFSGNLTEYQNFRNIFDSLIHKDEYLPKVQKLHYLISCLKGDAYQLIKHLTVSEANYDIAINLLQKRYYNPRLIAERHIEMILNIPSLVTGKIELREFINILGENTLALQTLNFDVDSWSFLLICICIKKITPELRSRFELQYSGGEIPTFVELLEFLETECRAQDVCKAAYQSKRESSRNNPHCHAAEQYKRGTCHCCKEHSHKIYDCNKFANMSIHQRRQVVKEKHLCWNCLREHAVKDCQSKSTCKVCKRNHHSLLHYENTVINGENTANIREENRLECSTSTCHSFRETIGTVLLGTAIVQVRDNFGEYSDVRVLLDSGSQCCLITEKCVARLGLKRHRSSKTVYGIGAENNGNVTTGEITCMIKPKFSEEPRITVSSLIMKTITGNLPSQNVSSDIIRKFPKLQLADPEFYRSRPVDMLLGAEIFNEIVDGNKISIDKNLPTAYSTIFGWVLLGKIGKTSEKSSSPISGCVTMDNSIQRFWELEECNFAPSLLSPEEERCEEHFTKTVCRQTNGRFMVRLPFKENGSRLGETHNIAFRRFRELERKLSGNNDLKLEYSKFIHEYISLGYIEKTSLSDVKYFMAHHCVVKETSSTTKVRVVFDASMRSSNNVSLNETLMSGPKLQQNIVDILLRFRVHKVVFSADIMKMYCQVMIHPDDRIYQGLIWRDSPAQEIEYYRLAVVPFGVTSSPYLAMRCLLELSKEEGKYPNACRILKNDIFVDDILSGASSMDEAMRYKNELCNLLNSAGFLLRKWLSNNEQFLSTLDDCSVESRSFDADVLKKVLGMQWNPHGDFFRYHASISDNSLTKRSILSNIARLYDPCGWLTPVTFAAKSLLQEIWLMKFDWDQPLTHEIEQRWRDYVSQFGDLSKIKIERFVGISNELYEFELHGFCDASEAGYGAVVYLRAQGVSGSVNISLILGRSKVAPLKQRLTIPKMELCGAVLLAKMMNHIKTVYTNVLSLNNLVAWCDSKVVLSWLRTPLHQFKIFEGSRVSQIHALGDSVEWRYVPSSLNPADCASRGLLPGQLVDHPLWFRPAWLAKPRSEWPNNPEVVNLEPHTHTELVHNVSTGQENYWDIIDRYSSLSKLIRVTALCRRFCNNIGKQEKISGRISITEWDSAMTCIVKNVQAVAFHREIAFILKGKSHVSSLRKLNPFIDANGVLRVGGRLRKAGISESAKHPIVLPKTHIFSQLVILYYHANHLHTGPSLTLSLLRQKFWILSGRDAVRRVIHKCIRCFRNRPKTVEPLMADLPDFRVNPARVFLHVGMDYAGPFSIRSSKLRGYKTQKAYMCIFICMATKAVHLELVSDLSTEAFLATLDRFVSRRGLCKALYSDWGTNFVGADNHLREVRSFLRKANECEDIHSYLLERKIDFIRNPPTASHFGGIFEAAVKSAKSLLRRVVGETSLTFEEMSTLFSRIEAILNSRPLCPMSENVDDLDTLTPAHFLIGDSLLSVPEFNFCDLAQNRLSRWEMLRQFSQRIWKRWQVEYLHTLQQRSKWTRNKENLTEGILVLIREDNVPPLKWKMGKIVELLPGSDGVVRVVKLKTSTGLLVRPVIKVCPLPGC